MNALHFAFREQSMRISSPDPRYRAEYVGTKLECYFDNKLIATLQVSNIIDARATLKDWARLDINIENLVYFQGIAKQYVGCTIDDIKYAEDGETVLIHGKQIEHI